MSSLSIVIFSRNRSGPLARAIAHYCHAGFPVIVADGSSEPLASEIASKCRHYLHMPSVDVYRRIHASVALVSSPAVALAADDDVMLPETLAACACRLMQDTSAVRVCGVAVHIGPDDCDLSRAVPDLPVERVLDLKNPSNATERYLELMRQSPQVFYSVVRTSVAKAVLEVLRPIPDGGAIVAEQLWTVLPALAGSTMIVDQLQSIRRVRRHPPDYRPFQSEVRQYQSLVDWPRYRQVTSVLLSVAGELGVSTDIVSSVSEHFARNSWLVQPRVALAADSPVRRLVRGARKYLWRPAAAFSYSSRVSATGIHNRRLVRCSAYPWLSARGRYDAAVGAALRVS